ncbi:MAG: hypothetical protein ACOH1N_01575 [Lutibacter sp.]
MKQLSILFIIGILFLGCKNDADKPENLANETEQFILKNDSLKKEIQLLKSLNDSLMKIENVAENYWFNPDFNGAYFIRLGIENPEKFVESSLQKRKDLIPAEAVLGGTMSFRNIQLLGNKWLIADYNDGHIQGRAIYEYKLNDKKELLFKMLASNDTE